MAVRRNYGGRAVLTRGPHLPEVLAIRRRRQGRLPGQVAEYLLHEANYNRELTAVRTDQSVILLVSFWDKDRYYLK